MKPLCFGQKRNIRHTHGECRHYFGVCKMFCGTSWRCDNNVACLACSAPQERLMRGFPSMRALGRAEARLIGGNYEEPLHAYEA